MPATRWESSLWRQGTMPLKSGGPTSARSCACTRATRICCKRWQTASVHTGDDDQRLPGAAYTRLFHHVLYLASIFLCTILEAGLVSTVPCMRRFCILFAHIFVKRGCQTKPRASSFDSVVETMQAFTTSKC
uniref:Putative transient receptor potential-related channel 7 n=1 Tax=Ixodes ricinus TaxID=34613 RepID=A0A6B0USG0_IXORI